jgi:hypothetical protein
VKDIGRWLQILQYMDEIEHERSAHRTGRSFTVTVEHPLTNDTTFLLIDTLYTQLPRHGYRRSHDLDGRHVSTRSKLVNRCTESA